MTVNRRYEVTFQLTTPFITRKDELKEMIDDAFHLKPVHIHGLKIRRL